MTIFDFLTLAIFSGLIVLFLQRSVDPNARQDHLWQYLIASCGCAVANYLGNNEHPLFAVVLIVGTLGYIHYVLRPLPQLPF